MRRQRLSWLKHGVRSSLPGTVTIFLSVLGSLPLVKVYDSNANLKRPKMARHQGY